MRKNTFDKQQNGARDLSARPEMEELPISSPTLAVLARLGTTPLVEREAECAFLSERCRVALQTEGGLIAITGEPGVGKTRLAFAAREQIVDADTRVLNLRCYEQTALLPYAPFLTASPSLPEVEQILIHRSAATMDASRISGARLGIFEQVDQCLLAYADAHPLLIIVDDLHWADCATLDLLHHLLRRGRRGGRVVLATVRPTGRSAPLPLGEFLADIAREHLLTDLPLQPLSQAGSTAVIQHLLGACSPDLLDALAERSGGVPFFLEELVRSLLIEQRLVRDQHGWHMTSGGALLPAGIVTLTLRRWRALPADTRQVVQVAALIGTAFTLSVLSQVLAQPIRVVGELLAPASDAQFVQPDAAQPHGWRFVHALMCDALYADIPPDQRRQWHRQVMQILMDGEGGESAALVAYHADRAHAWQIAFTAHLAAAETAQQELASNDAVAHLVAAQDLLRAGVGITSALPPFALERRLITALLRAGRMDEAEQAAQALVQAASTVTDRATEGWAWVRLGQAAIFTHHLAEAETALAQGRAIAEDLHDDRLLVAALAETVVLYEKRGLLEAGEAAVKLALPLAEQLGDRGLALHGFIYYGYLLNWRGQFAEAVTLLREAHALSIATHDVLSLANARFGLALALAGQGEYGEALRELQHLLDYAAMTGSPYYAIRAPNTIGWIYRELGLPAQAREWDERAIATTANPEQAGYFEAFANSLLNLASDCILLGQWDEAADALRRAEACARQDEYMRWRNLNRLALCQGELALGQGDAMTALALAHEAMAQAQANAAQKYISQAHDLAGRAQRALGQLPEALASLEASVAIAAAIGYHAGHWRTLTTLSAIYRQLGRADLARDAQAQAQAVLTAILETVDDPAIVHLLQTQPTLQAVLATPASRATRNRYPAGLTAREVEVLRLVTQGQTNREIAAALVLSERTVNSHLVRIFNKLGVNSRAAAAAFATRYGWDS